jgi:peptidoglycan/LPS O-acetylase OafA/YrhL
MFVSHFQKEVLQIMSKAWFIVLLGVIGLMVFEVNQHLSAGTLGHTYPLNSLTKTLLSILLMFSLSALDAKISSQFHKAMAVLADLSFGLYFLHGYFMISYFGLIELLFGTDYWLKRPSFVTFLAAYTVTIGLSIFTIFLIKRFFEKHSRYIVGC